MRRPQSGGHPFLCLSAAHPAVEREGREGVCHAVIATSLATALVLGSLPSAVSCARAHVRLVLAEWGLAHLRDSVEMVLSELLTNAIQASQGLTGHWWRGVYHHGRPPVRVWLRSDGACCEVSVWDGHEGEPQRQEPDADQEDGRGLLIVHALAEFHGVERIEDASGKVCWAMVTGRWA